MLMLLLLLMLSSLIVDGIISFSFFSELYIDENLHMFSFLIITEIPNSNVKMSNILLKPVRFQEGDEQLDHRPRVLGDVCSPAMDRQEIEKVPDSSGKRRNQDQGIDQDLGANGIL